VEPPRVPPSRAADLSTCMQSSGSSERMRTVESGAPTACATEHRGRRHRWRQEVSAARQG